MISLDTSKHQSYSDSRIDILKIIPTTPSRVLDIGCSTGNLGRSIKDNFNSYVVGVDSDLKSLAEAKSKIDEAYHIDLDFFQNKFSNFDLIICADVLEHTKNPNKVLLELLKSLSSNGYVIISLPNIQHWTAIFNLMIGKWPQRERGIFDRTHLRFFTLSSIVELCAECDLEILKVSRNFRLIDQAFHPLNKFSFIFKFLPFKNYFTYQYVLLLSFN